MHYIRTLHKSGDKVIDLFHGFGGFSIAAEMNGLSVVWALNHDEHKVRVHSENFPNTIHVQEDVKHTNPRQHPRTNIFLGSPCCTDFSQAKTHKTKLLHEQQMRMFAEDEKQREKAIAERQKRATMWSVIDFAAVHKYDAMVIENVVEVHRWGDYNKWVTDLKNLGYNLKMLYFNSMFFHELNDCVGDPAPQSRDRWFCVATRTGIPLPELDFRPLAPCPNCGDVRARQIWKNPNRQYGKYGIEHGSYYYGCPTCVEPYKNGVRPLPLHPYYYCGLNAIDFTIPIQRIGDFKKPISQNTRARVQVGLDRFAGDPFMMNGNMWKYRSALLGPAFTQTTQRHQWVVIPPFFINNSHSEAKLHVSLAPAPAQTGSRTMTVVVPHSFISALDPSDIGQSRTKSVFEPIPTQTGWKNQQAIAAVPVLIDLAHSKIRHENRVRPGSDTWPTQTTEDTLGVFWPTWLVELYGNGNVRSSFDPTNAATAGGGKTGVLIPPFVATYNGGHPVYAGMNDALPTATANERHGLTIPQNLTVDDCYYRTLRSKYEVAGEYGAVTLQSEIGRVMGFPNRFIFFGTVDDVTEGFGGAVTPAKVGWIIKQVKKVLN